MPFHYTYRLTAQNPIDDRVEYIGVRSCECDPANDTAYMSSSREVKALIKSGMVFVKEIIATWPSRKAALAHEVALHAEHDVARSGLFFNKAKQTATGFDAFGNSDAVKAQWKNPVSRAKRMESLTSAEFKANRSKLSKEMFARPDVKNAHRDGIKAMWCKPEFKARHAASMAKALSNPQTIENISRAGVIAWENSERRDAASKRMEKQWSVAENRDALSSKMKATLAAPESREKWASAQTSDDVQRRRQERYAIRRKYAELSGYQGDMKKITTAEALDWLNSNSTKAA